MCTLTYMTETEDIVIHKKLREILRDYPAVEWTISEDKFTLSVEGGLVIGHMNFLTYYLSHDLNRHGYQISIRHLAKQVMKGVKDE